MDSGCHQTLLPHEDGSCVQPPDASKPHVRWCGRMPGRNPRHPTRSVAVSSDSSARAANATRSRRSVDNHVRAVIGQNLGKYADKAVRAPPSKFLNTPGAEREAEFALVKPVEFRRNAAAATKSV